MRTILSMLQERSETASGFWTKIFNIQNKKFITLFLQKMWLHSIVFKENAKSIENIVFGFSY